MERQNNIDMTPKQYMYFGPITICGPKIETFDSFDKIPKRIKTQMKNCDEASGDY